MTFMFLTGSATFIHFDISFRESIDMLQKKFVTFVLVVD